MFLHTLYILLTYLLPKLKTTHCKTNKFFDYLRINNNIIGFLYFQRMDLNKDGVVSFDEFMETCKNDENIIRAMILM